VSFLVGHSFIEHKETRFLMPVIYPLLILTVIGFEALSDRLALPRNPFCSSRLIRVLVYGFFLLNGLALTVFTFVPANQETVVQKWMYRQSRDAPLELVTYRQNPYQDGSGTIGFLRSPEVSFLNVRSPQDFQKFQARAEGAAYLFIPQAYPPTGLMSLCAAFTLEASALPKWVRRIDRQRWFSGLRIWSIYHCSLNSS